MLNLFCTSTIQGRELCWRDFIRNTINSVLCWDTREPNCFKLGMMLDMTNPYSLIPIWMTLMFSKGHRVAGKQSLHAVILLKVAWNNSNIRDGWLCKENDCGEVLYGGYRLFEHLLYLFYHLNNLLASVLCFFSVETLYWLSYWSRRVCSHWGLFAVSRLVMNSSKWVIIIWSSMTVLWSWFHHFTSYCLHYVQSLP